MSRRKTRRPRRDEVTQRVLVGGTVTLATMGCSNCSDNGAVDPPPPPLVCGDLGAGQGLGAYGARSASGIEVSVYVESTGKWQGVPSVTEVENLVLEEVALESGAAKIRFQTPPDSVATGRFTLAGTILDSEGTECAVNRRFTMQLGTGSYVEVSEAVHTLPLGNREGALIELAAQDGLIVHLRASGATPGWELIWSVSAGTLENTGDGVRWTLPATPGLYQAELLTDHGPHGFALDVLPLEVS